MDVSGIISTASIGMSMNQVQSQVGIAMMKEAMDLQASAAQTLTQQMLPQAAPGQLLNILA